MRIIRRLYLAWDLIKIRSNDKVSCTKRNLLLTSFLVELTISRFRFCIKTDILSHVKQEAGLITKSFWFYPAINPSMGGITSNNIILLLVIIFCSRITANLHYDYIWHQRSTLVWNSVCTAKLLEFIQQLIYSFFCIDASLFYFKDFNRLFQILNDLFIRQIEV